jgi:flagellar hook-basal body complex protein FliE
MAVDISSAVHTLDKALRTGAGTGMEPSGGSGSGGSGGIDFGEMLKEATEDVVDKLQAADAQSLEAVAGTASLDEVVMAVTQAEMALNTVVSIRDRVIQAYQEILRMPI